MTHDAEDALTDDAGPDARTEVVQLRRAMETRPVIDLARGVLMASFNLTPEEAWTVLVMVSQHTNTKLHRLAQDIVDAVKGPALTAHIQHQLTAAVTQLAITPGTTPA
ncbi:ANTAR domain-containing protein [Streptomyces sp. FXJ1.172]|uniref:ANTAR domain-containing protein n=1 Tax=Streptomyces sp. FXJ1.172 TaxID=710705 RepID=UPI000D17EEAA|nr:ANTAR domain-containing protein [Streptomyces sp. FXJ1.172]WEO92933.1 ANTAR domain-containing protein [Streptomyces sp. FXJ1.172]